MLHLSQSVVFTKSVYGYGYTENNELDNFLKTLVNFVASKEFRKSSAKRDKLVIRDKAHLKSQHMNDSDNLQSRVIS